MLTRRSFSNTNGYTRSTDDYCALMENMHHSGLSYGFRPVPFPGKIDAASVFFDKSKFVAENIAFSKFCSGL